jgi:peroxiredoxin
MTAVELRAPVRVGESAPDFALPAVHREGLVSLSDYRGRKPVLLGLFRGLWCPFCRRQIVQLGVIGERLLVFGIEPVAIVATSVERARLYFQYRRVPIPLAADEDLTTHRAYGLRVSNTPEFLQLRQTVLINPTGELSRPMTPPEAHLALDRLDGVEPTEADEEERARQILRESFLLIGQFLVDRTGIVRWTNIEGAREGLAGLGKFPSDQEFLTAAQAL